MSSIDPIREKYFQAVETGERCSDILFYVGCVLSFITVFVERSHHPRFYDATVVVFLLVTIAFFVIGIVTRLYLLPRAGDKRMQDFLSSTFGLNLTHERTEGYYNNDFTAPIKRLVAQLLENAFFTKSISLKMVRVERLKVFCYGVTWCVCVAYRRTDLGVILAATQAIFSEQIISKWIRLEWLRHRSETIFDNGYKLLQRVPAKDQFLAATLELLVLYESTKANAATTLSARIFNDCNDELSNEWSSILATIEA